MHKLPTFSGYCPPGQLRSMSRRLACAAVVAARARYPWPDPKEHTAAVARAAELQRLTRRDAAAGRLLRVVLVATLPLVGLGAWLGVVLPARPAPTPRLPYYAYGPASIPFHYADEP